MNISQLISKKLGDPSLTSKTSKRVAVTTIGVSTSIILIALFITLGFRSQISDKIYNSIGAIQIQTINPLNLTNVNTPILNPEAIAQINDIITPQKLKTVIQAPGILQKNNANIGVVMVSVDDNDIKNDEIVISNTAAKILEVEVGQTVDVVMMGELPTRKMMTVNAMFSLGMNEIERSMVFVNQEVARNVAGIDPTEISYYKIDKPIQNIDQITEICDEYQLNVSTAQQRAPQIFDWLDMIDQNMMLVLIIMTIVAIIGVVSATLIVILEHTTTIATLRAIGMKKQVVRLIFVKYMGRIMIKGLAIGTMTAIAIGSVQMKWKVIKLDSKSYFVDAIPIEIDPMMMSVLIMAIVAVMAVAIIIPTTMIAKMKIAQSLKFS